MLSDLRKYITDSNEIISGTSYYLKALLERCKDEALVNQILLSTAAEKDEIVDNEVDIFSNLIIDYHLVDLLYSTDPGRNVCCENIIINLMLRCYLDEDQYIIFDKDEMIVDAFMRYTARGRKLSGCRDDKLLADYIQKEWKDLESEFEGVSDEELINEYMNYDNELSEDYGMVTMTIIVDDNDGNYEEVTEILEFLRFVEVTPGLFYYGCFGYVGYEELDVYTTYPDMDYIGVWDLPRRRNLDEYNELLNLYSCVEGCDRYLYLLISDIHESNREVLF